MAEEIEKIYFNIQSKLDLYINSENKCDIEKIKKNCQSTYNGFIKFYDEGKIKKKKIECFNWYEIYLKLLEYEKDVMLSKQIFDPITKKQKKDEGIFSKHGKDYVMTNKGRRIYKIVSKSIEYVNNSIDCDYDSNYCIFDIIKEYKEDTINREYFPYKENETELYMIFMEKPCCELMDEIEKNGIKALWISDMRHNPISERTIVNIDINIIISLCSDAHFLTSNSPIFEEIISNGIFIGFDVDETKTLSGEKFYDFIMNEKVKIENEIMKYTKVIMCKAAYNDTKRILETYGSENERKRIDEIMKKFNIEIIDDTKYECDIIEKYKKNCERTYNKVERDVIKIGYVFNAITLTSNHRYVDFLLSKNILIEANIISSMNLLCKAQYRIKKNQQ
jgi:hypothetical protein